MKKILIKNKGILISLMLVTLVITVSSIGITYSKYKAKTDVKVASTTGKLKCSAKLDISDTYVENNETYFNVIVKNSNENIVSDTDLGYTLTITNQDGSKGKFSYEGSEYKETLVIEGHYLNKILTQEKLKIKVKSDNAIKTQVDFKVNLSCFQVEKAIIKNPFDEGTLAYKIFDNATNPKDDNSTIYSPEPKTTPAQQINDENERTLSVTQDDDGNSYYFRGNVQDNYLNFNNMCWRIVRIEGDCSVKLILYDEKNECASATGGENAFIGEGTYGYKIGTIDELENIEIPDFENCTLNKETCAYTKLQEWYDEKMKTKQDLLKNELWNIGDIEKLYKDENELNYGYRAYFDNGRRLSNKNLNSNFATLLSKGVSFESYIGLVTIDEVALAGMKYADLNIKNNNIYLNLNVETDKAFMMLLSPMGIWNTQAGIYTFDFNHLYIGNIGVRANFIIRPSIVLIPKVELTGGDGTKDKPYTLSS